ncbi:discoidin domain-containing protein [Dactylosporangium sp. NPDC006015]|uniref:discoidin domain-containing protein n=1 Tax=Dactylosporangium sp. NPDC006015 TaxID=3154576 RepID=UPI0033A83790
MAARRGHDPRPRHGKYNEGEQVVKIGYRRARPGPFAGRWGRLLASALVALAVSTGSVVVLPTTAHAAPVSTDPEQRRRGLFSAYMRSRTSGHEGLRNMYVSAEMVGYKQLNPNATARQVLEHGVKMNEYYKSHLVANDLERPMYLLATKLLELTAKNPAGSIAAPILQQMMQETLGKQLTKYGTMVDEIYASQFESAYLTQVFQVMDNQWTAVATYGANDPEFRAAWNGYIGALYGVSADATVEALEADPLIGTFVDVQALKDLQVNSDLYLAEGNRQLTKLLKEINAQVGATNAELDRLNTKFPVQGANPSPSDYEVAKANAAARQVWIDQAAGAVKLLSILVGFANKDAGKFVSVAGNAAVQIATAVNNFLPTIAAKGLSGALFSMTGIGLAANVLGAVQSLLPLFASGPSPEQQILEQMTALKEQVKDLKNEMNERFNRIETALGNLYDALYDQFDVVVKLHQATQAQLQTITANLAKLTEQVDYWGHALLTADQQAGKDAVITTMNNSLDYRFRAGREMSSTYYFDAATSLQGAASNKSTVHPQAAPLGVQAPENALRDYGQYGSIAWLNQYAYANLGLPQTSRVSDTPSVEFWLLAAEGYKTLLAQNPAQASTVNGVTADVTNAGEAIQYAVRQFSLPQPAGGPRLNPVYTKLLETYRTTASAMATEFQKKELAALNQATDVNIAGLPSQQVPKPAEEPGGISVCAGSGMTASRPSNVVSLDLNELWVANRGRAETPVQTCYQAAWVNMTEPPEQTDKPYALYADLEVQFRVQQVWNGQPVVARTWTKVIPYGKMAQVYPPRDTRKSWLTKPDDAMRANWVSTYKATFQQSATRSDNAEAVRKVRDWLYGAAGQYYADVTRELLTPGTTLNDLNTKLTQTVMLLEAYTKLGFAKSMRQDERVGLYLLGTERVPSDHGEQRVLAPFATARDNYCSSVTGDGKCVVKAPEAGKPEPTATAGQKPTFVPCTNYTTKDPIGGCFNELQGTRSELLRQRLEEATVRIATVPGFTEGIAAVDYMLGAIQTAEQVAKHPLDLAYGKPATASSVEIPALAAMYAVDGDPGTRWSSLYSDPQWLQVDLGSTKSISRVRLTWEFAYARGYEVQLSNDGTNWDTVYSTGEGDGGVDDLTVERSGRYLRIYGTARGTSYGYSLWSVEAFA